MKLTVKASLAQWRRRLAYRRRKLAAVRRSAHHSGVTHAEAAHIHKWERLVNEAATAVRHRERQLASQTPLRARALAEGLRLVGVMEVGGNNMGREVLKLIRENGGTGPESWCGDFVAHCYRAAGSKVVQRGWAAVRLLGFLTGMKVIPLREALPGDIICYTFDHTGIFRHFVASGVIETVEGNTGRVGAVSDSRTGGDGVYIKHRSTTLVARVVRVTR
jgi:hypothetical protein